MFWTGFIVGLLTPVVGFLLWILFDWLLDRGTWVQCRCGVSYGVMPHWVKEGIEKDNGDLYKRPTLNRITDLKMRWHRWFHCPLRKAERRSIRNARRHGGY